MVSKWIALAVYILLGLCESAFVDSLSKCAHKDGECQKDLIQKLIVDYSKTGIPEYEVPPFDPIKIKDLTVSFLGLLNVTIEDGEGVGMKDCIINSLSSHIDKGFTEVELTCDFVLKAKFKVSGSSPNTDQIFGGKAIHGDGNGEMKIEKLHMNLKFFYDLVKKDDGEIYAKFMFDDTEFVYELQNFHAMFDKIFIGEEDVSEHFVKYINDNWKLIFKMFGKTIFDASGDLLRNELNRITDSIPVSKIISDDLTPYLKNK